MPSKSRGRGEISELTHVVPIKQGVVPGKGITYADRLRTVLEMFHAREDQGFPGVTRLFRGIHNAQWALLDGDTRLLLNVVFDGDLRSYLRALARDVAGSVALVWSNCEGFRPTHEDPMLLIEFIERHQVRNNFFYAQHPQLSVPDIDALLALRDALDGATSDSLRALRAALHAASTPQPLAARTHAALAAQPGYDYAKAKAALRAVLDGMFQPDEVERALGETFRDVAPAINPAADLQRAQQIQANVIEPLANAHCARMLFYSFASPTDAREWLRALRPSIRYFRTADPGPYPTIGFTHAGLEALGVDAALLSEFPDAFVQGMDARARALGDAPHKPARAPWTRVLDAAAPVHAVVWVHAEPPRGSALYQQLLAAGRAAREQAGQPARTPQDYAADALIDALGQHLDAAVRDLVPAPAGVRCIGYQDLHLPLVQPQQGEPYGVEYFGFRDGIGQPRMPTEEGCASTASFDAVLLPKGKGLLKNATFLVARQLRQDCAGFWTNMADKAGSLPLSKQQLAEEIVGRRMDGRRLDSTAADFDPHRDRDAFDHGGDSRCPLHSHARRMNPRTETDLGHNPQLVRRSLAYAHRRGDEQVRGLMFIGFNADIETQFELMQRHWTQAGNQVGLSSRDRDVLTGLGTQAARFAAHTFDKGFVELEWGIYLYIPAREALSCL